MDDKIMDFETIEEIADNLRSVLNKLGEVFSKIAKELGEILKDNMNKLEKPKFKPVKNLIKPYRQPFIKVRYRARSNL